MTFATDAGGAIPPRGISELASAVSGRVLAPGDDGYAAETAIYNLNIPYNPAVVVVAADPEDVRAAVTFAARHQLPLTMKTAGHQIVRPADGAVLVSTRALDDISIDTRRRTARVGSGVIWQQVLDRSAPAGLAPLSGSAPYVGATGYTLGGGQSPVLGRTYGYAADRVRSLDLVTADGLLRRVTHDTNPDLFWALRGAKGNFGIVTSMEFELFPVTRYYGGGLYFAGEHLADVLHTWRAWLPGLSRETTSSLAVQRLPPLPALPEPLRGAFIVHLRFAHLGTAAEAESIVAPLRAAAPVLFDTVAENPYMAMASIHSDPVDPMPYYDRTTMLREFPEEAADALIALVGPDSGSPLVTVEIRSLGGAFDDTPAIPNAVSTRGLPFVVFGFGVGTSDRAGVLRGALADVVDGLAPWAAPRQMINFLSPDEGVNPGGVEEIYGAATYQRLTGIKKIHDPDNLFRINHNITPG